MSCRWRVFNITSSIGWDSETTNQLGYTYFGSDTDWTGFDDGTRDVPAKLAAALSSGNPVLEGANFTQNDLEGIAIELVNAETTLLQQNNQIPVNWSFGLSGGKTWPIADGELGIIAKHIAVLAPHGVVRHATFLASLGLLLYEAMVVFTALVELPSQRQFTPKAAKELAAIISTLEAVDCRTLAVRLGKTTHELAQDDKHLMDIMTALSFQDLVAQRVKKLVTIIEDVQCKLVELVVVFGLKEESATPETQGKAGEMLRQLEASKSTAIKQDLADELLSEFGFK